jgi:predicted RNA binding protein YcfA (HicA-like mRNA interferase family)
VVRALEKAGFSVRRQHGSHIIDELLAPLKRI